MAIDKGGRDVVMIINPGSGAVRDSGEGWTNTFAGALAEAEKWLQRMRADGIRDVEMTAGDPAGDEGRWTFHFRHAITGVTVDLVTPGIDDLAAYEAERVFFPRVYWKGSSSSDPQVEDWAAPGFDIVKTFEAL